MTYFAWIMDTRPVEREDGEDDASYHYARTPWQKALHIKYAFLAGDPGRSPEEDRFMQACRKALLECGALDPEDVPVPIDPELTS